MDRTCSEKTQVADLALFGGPTLFEDLLHVGCPNIGDRRKFFELVDDMFDRRWLTNNGPFVKEFEERLANIVGTKHCIAVCNATIGLELAVRAVGMTGEVIVPSFTFIASAHVLEWQGIKPVFCDIDPETHNIDPNRIEELITPRTTGIVGVHVWGRPCEIEALEMISSKYDLKLVFDAAHAFGCSYQGKPIGGFGDAEVFSFHATKFFNTFEGGMIATNDDDLAKKLRMMKNFGFSGKDTVLSIGINGKMSEISAAMGIVGLESLEEFVSINQRNYHAYKKIFSKLPGIKLITYDENESQNYQYIIMEIDDDTAGINRDLIVDILTAENILARRYFFPGCHEMEPYRSSYSDYETFLPETEKLTQSVMSLPNGTSISINDVERMGQLLRFVLENSNEIREKHASIKTNQ